MSNYHHIRGGWRDQEHPSGQPSTPPPGNPQPWMVQAMSTRDMEFNDNYGSRVNMFMTATPLGSLTNPLDHTQLANLGRVQVKRNTPSNGYQTLSPPSKSRRASHNATEQRRRNRIKEKIEEFKDIVPGIVDSDRKAAILQKSLEYIKRLKSENEQLSKLTAHGGVCVSGSDEVGPPHTPTHASHIHPDASELHHHHTSPATQMTSNHHHHADPMAVNVGGDDETKDPHLEKAGLPSSPA
eukprot:CAMPEP_0177659126 /NCGR_PEP_ID=MMETSP0447-20121125/17263_1 /TAXON_ID=0 /ORGANISM="Stygamoeba regulata, Strain BSH-02190019" /LENGTH=239 /DNA_ID=CAMNT_0019163949 /DNA_START=222 /DNA_END=941 /DNA_ORIENTATION=-